MDYERPFFQVLAICYLAIAAPLLGALFAIVGVSLALGNSMALMAGFFGGAVAVTASRGNS